VKVALGHDGVRAAIGCKTVDSDEIDDYSNRFSLDEESFIRRRRRRRPLPRRQAGPDAGLGVAVGARGSAE
jgi:hypothetical protein